MKSGFEAFKDMPLAKKAGAANNRGNSKQDYATPHEFIRAVEARYGKLEFDLAASENNAKAYYIFTVEHQSLAQPWAEILDGRLAWLNPPFGSIAPWAMKCAAEAKKGARILLLTPASVDTIWWADYIHGRAWVDFLSPRIQFDGADDPFPKPLSLSCFNISGTGYGPWRWKP